MAITKRLTSGLIEESLGRLSEKSSYTPPSIRTVDFVVEKGFQSSGDDPIPVGNKFYVESTNQLEQTESTDYQWSTAEEGWF